MQKGKALMFMLVDTTKGIRSNELCTKTLFLEKSRGNQLTQVYVENGR